MDPDLQPIGSRRGVTSCIVHRASEDLRSSSRLDFTLLHLVRIIVFNRRVMTEPALLHLPRELRDIIFTHILPTRIKLIKADPERTSTFFTTNGIFLTNHQLRSEALAVLYRQLHITTLVAPRQSLFHLLENPRAAYLRDSIQDLVIQREYIECGLRYFKLRPASHEGAELPLTRIIKPMCALRRLTCEISWRAFHAPSVLLPGTRNLMVGEFLMITTGEEKLVGWKVDCKVVDMTRWKKEMSGIVVLEKVRVGRCRVE